MILSAYVWIFLFTFLLFIPTISFSQDDEDSIIDPWSFSDQFWKDLILVLIPTGVGIFTTVRLTDRWQIRKEKLDIRRRVLDEFDSAIVAYGFRLNTFDRILMDNYTKIRNDTVINEHGKIDNIDIEFPTNPDQHPSKKLSQNYLELAEDTGDIFNALWKFESSLEFYYKDQNLNSKVSRLVVKIRLVFFELQKMYFADNVDDFRKYHNSYGALYTALQKEFHSLRKELLSKEPSDELFKKKHRLFRTKNTMQMNKNDSTSNTS